MIAFGRSGRARRGKAPVWLALLALAVGATGCATAPASRPSVGLRIEASRPDATVWIDDRLMGTADDLVRRGGVALPPGYHRVEVRHPACYSAYRDVELLPSAGPQALSVSLRPLLD